MRPFQIIVLIHTLLFASSTSAQGHVPEAEGVTRLEVVQVQFTRSYLSIDSRGNSEFSAQCSESGCTIYTAECRFRRGERSGTCRDTTNREFEYGTLLRLLNSVATETVAAEDALVVPRAIDCFYPDATLVLLSDDGAELHLSTESTSYANGRWTVTLDGAVLGVVLGGPVGEAVAAIVALADPCGCFSD